MDQQILGDYKIIKKMGQGSLGKVFVAEHRFMKKQYILKVLPEELASDREFIHRFEKDVSLIATLDHPNIVKIHNISFSSGYYFIVSDCIVDQLGESTNLGQYLIKLNRFLEEKELFHILNQIAEALDYAHKKVKGEHSLVHRSLKLNNILVGSGKEGLQVYLSDFGLSHLIGSGAVLTRTFKNMAEALGIAFQTNGQDGYPQPAVDQLKLTPLHHSFLQNYAFLAPEQKRIESYSVVDSRADVFAFGVLTYFLLTKQFPEGVFDFPSQIKSFEYEWDEVIRQCLQVNPEKRATSLVQLLESILPKQKVIEQPPEFVEEVVAKCTVQMPFVEEKKHVEEVVSVAQTAVHTVTINESSHTLKPVLQTPQLERPVTDLDPGAIFQVQSTVKTYSPELKDVTHIKPILTEMMVIPGGTFYRGSQDGNRDEMPMHQVTLSSFAIDVHPVTNEQFVRFLEVMGGEKDNNHNDIIRLRDSRIKRAAGKLSIESGYNKHPVVGVTWYGAVAYAKWVGKRLPTEAEWEISARGGIEGLFYPTGVDIEKSQANFFSSDTTAVMSYAPNAFGLYDMTGNVYEWCNDWYGYNYYEHSMQEPENPKGPLQGVYRVMRGGCWKSLKEDLRCSRRHRNNPGTVNGTYGFRCVADVEVSN